jgi:AcrR family transcriptional regulator
MVPSSAVHETRLLEGMADAITEKGYAATTIADVVRHARVSKRTFYEHFADKEACFLALYVFASESALGVIAEAARSDLPWRERIETSTRAYLDALAERPAVTRTLLVEIQAAGPRALELRRHVMQRFADQLRALHDEAREELPGLRVLSPALATALVGGINELCLLAVEQGRTDRLGDLTDTAVELLLAVLTAAPSPTPS